MYAVILLMLLQMKWSHLNGKNVKSEVMTNGVKCRHFIYTYTVPFQVLEMFSSEGDLHLELPTGDKEAPKSLWVRVTLSEILSQQIYLGLFGRMTWT